jgi:hypothetical protein
LDADVSEQAEMFMRYCVLAQALVEGGLSVGELAEYERLKVKLFE